MLANFFAESIAMIALKFDLQVYLSNILLYRNHCHNINVLVECCCTEQIKIIFIVDLQYPYQYVPIPIICEQHRLIGGIFNLNINSERNVLYFVVTTLTDTHIKF